MYSQTGTSKDRTARNRKTRERSEGLTDSDDTPSNIDSRKPRVMIVEDHAVLRESLRMYFEIKGFETNVAGGYEDALKAADGFKPDVAICDRQLDGNRDGVDVARDLQRKFGCAIVFVSGTSMEKLRSETRDLDVVAYMKKPVLPTRIEGAISSIASRGSGNRN